MSELPIGIGGGGTGAGSSRDAKSSLGIFDSESKTEAFLPPRMTTTQRDAIVSPVAGMVVYNTITRLILSVY